MVISAYLGVAGLAGVGYQFYNADESVNGARITAGIVDSSQGYYSVANATLPLNAVSVRWDSTSDATAYAREYFAATNIVPPLDSPGVTTLLARIASVLTITGGKVDVNGPVTVSANNDKTGYALTSAQVTGIADELLKRDWLVVTGEANFSLLNALRAIRNAWNLAPDGTLTVFRENGTTVCWQRNIRTDVTAKPIVGAD